MGSIIRGSDNLDSQKIVVGSAKAWVNFNGTGTVAIRDSFNISSVTDLGVGKYQPNFVSPMPDTNFVVVGGVERTLVAAWTINSYNVNYTQVNSYDGGNVLADFPLNLAIFSN